MMLNKREWNERKSYGISGEWSYKYADRLSFTQTQRRQDYDEHKGVLTTHPLFLSSSISVTFCVNTLHIQKFLWQHFRHKIRLYGRVRYYFALGSIFITLVISTGRPDLAAVIMGSSPLACLRFCAAAVMSYKQPNSSRSINQTAASRGNKSTKESPLLTFICLERSAARKNACRLSNRKSTCCWATRTIRRKRSETLLCVTHSHIRT